MAEFLDTQAISNELMKLIKDAKDKIILVSYNFKVNLQIQERLKTKSKIGTLSEIVIVYGRTDLKQKELEWIKEIKDYKLIEKPNLHAKCYLNEERAIICSMNLYDYSQQNNIEMGILITKEDDKIAYEKLIDEINNIKINGIRKYPDTIDKPEQILKSDYHPTENVKISRDDKNSENVEIILSLEQKLNWQLLKNWRLAKSKEEKTSAFKILTDQEITRIVSVKKLDKYSIYDILPKKIVIKYGEEILDVIKQASLFTIGQVKSIWYQTDDSKYDRVKLKISSTGHESWFDTTQELPTKDRVVAVLINKTWFNYYIYLDN